VKHGLTGLKVLITRPRERADELCQSLASQGAAVAHHPLLVIDPLDPRRDSALLQRNRQLALELDRYQRIVCVSVTAVEHGLDWLENFWPQWPLQQGWFGVGVATARALAERGLPASQPGGAMNSEALLAEPDWQRLDGQRVLIIRGVGGRNFLAQSLRRRGGEVDFMECYRRRPPAPAEAARLLAAAEQAHVIGVSSGQSLAHLEQIWRGAGRDPADLKATLLLPGDRVAELARRAGFFRLQVAANASTAATVAALQQWWPREQGREEQ